MDRRRRARRERSHRRRRYAHPARRSLDGIRVTAGGFTARDRVSTGGTIDAVLLDGTDDHQARRARVLDVVPRTAGSARSLPRRTSCGAASSTTAPARALSLVATGPLGTLLDGDMHYVAGIAPELAYDRRFTSRRRRSPIATTTACPMVCPGVVSTERHRRDRHETPLTYRMPVPRALQWRARRALARSLARRHGERRRVLSVQLDAAGGGRQRAHVHRRRDRDVARQLDEHARARAARVAPQPAPRVRARSGGRRHPPAPQRVRADDAPRGSSDSPTAATTTPRRPIAYPNVPNCPIPFGWFASGGAGPLSDQTGDRPSLTADVAHRDRQQRPARRRDRRGHAARHRDATSPAARRSARLFPGHTPGAAVRRSDAALSSRRRRAVPDGRRSVLRYRTRYTAAYVEDTWHADAGHRGRRRHAVGAHVGRHRAALLERVRAARSASAGIRSATAGRGCGPAWGAATRCLPAGSARRSSPRDRTVDKIVSQFGEGRLRRYRRGHRGRARHRTDRAGRADHRRRSRARQDGARDHVAPGPLAAPRHRHDDARLRQPRPLRRDPGAPRDRPVRRRARDGTDRASSCSAPATCTAARSARGPARSIPARAQFYMRGRDYDADVGRTSSVSCPPTSATASSSRRQRGGHVGPVELAVSTRLTAGSGRPRSVARRSATTASIFLIPRGTAGRGPLLTQANVRVAARWHDFDITLDLFNVFNQRDGDQRRGAVRGRLDQADRSRRRSTDLVFLKNEAGADGAARARRYAIGDRVPDAVRRGARHPSRVLKRSVARGICESPLDLAPKAVVLRFFVVAPRTRGRVLDDARRGSPWPICLDSRKPLLQSQHSPHAVSAWEEAEGLAAELDKPDDIVALYNETLAGKRRARSRRDDRRARRPVLRRVVRR